MQPSLSHDTDCRAGEVLVTSEVPNPERIGISAWLSANESNWLADQCSSEPEGVTQGGADHEDAGWLVPERGWDLECGNEA